MPARLQVQNLRDFTGGLNLRSDVFQLDENESPDLLNVDVDPRGGFHQRWGTSVFASTAFSTAAVSTYEFATTTGLRHVLVHAGGSIHSSSGGAFTARGSRSGVCRFASFKDRAYAVNGAQNALRWDGAAAASVADANASWNDNLETPTAATANGHMPRGKVIAAHGGHMWVANTTEGGKSYPNRVRFSHPNFPEDWRSYDFFDVDPGVDGDEITALVPFADRLLVFKKRSVFAIYGTDPETWQVFPVSREMGAISQEACVGTDLGVYFWSWPEGVFLYDGKSTTWQFERMAPAVKDGKIPHAYSDQIHLGWGNRRLWAAVPWEGSSTRTRTLVLDPTLGKRGSWVMYDLAVGAFLEWNPPGADAHLLAVHETTHRTIRLDARSPYDNFGDGPVPITSHFRTSWIDMGEQAIHKRWKRPEIVLRGGTTSEIYVKCLHDWDPTFAVRSFALNTVADDDDIGVVVPDPQTGAPVGDGWGSGQWGVMKWGRAGYVGGSVPGSSSTAITSRNVIQRGVPLGNARAISLEFHGPDTTSSWGVDSLALKYIPRRPRS